MKNYLGWRQKQNIDTILVSDNYLHTVLICKFMLLKEYDFNQFDTIKALCPNGFHCVDKQGRPIFIIQVGEIKFLELMAALG